MPVFCFDQLVVVKEEDGGRKAVCYWLRGPTTDTPTKANVLRKVVNHSSVIGISQELNAPKQRCENLEQGQSISSMANYSNKVFTTFYHLREQGVPGLSRGKSSGAWY
jgi:hypothetical protein